jgi:AcrR family transcriptional regulator
LQFVNLVLIYVDARYYESVSGGGVTAPRRRGPRKGDLKEQAILETAERLLAERPLDDIGIDELARGADISRPTFYFYFESKGAVLRALIDRITEEAYATAEWLGRTDMAPREAIQKSLEGTAKLWREHGPVLRAAVEAWGTVPELRLFWEQVIAGFVEASAEQIKRERRAGVAPNGGPSAKALATALVWLNERCFYTASVGADPALSEREMIGTLSTIWLRAIYRDDDPGAVTR